MPPIINEDALDALTLVSFLIGVANYNENLTQSDKDELLKRLEQQTNDIVEKIESDLEKQNVMLERIMATLEEIKEKIDAS